MPSFCRKALALCLVVSLTLLLPGIRRASAQQPSSAAPVPAQILHAHTVFVSNAGGDPAYTAVSGGVNRAYDQFYADLQRWPRLTLVATPQQADLILEVRSLANPSTTGTAGPTTVTTTYTPEIQLRILDPQTRTTLWTLDSWLHNPGIRQSAHNKAVDQAVQVLVLQLRQLMGDQLSPDQNKAASRGPGPSRRSAWIWTAVVVIAVVVPLAIVLANRHSQPKLTQPTLPPQPIFP